MSDLFPDESFAVVPMIDADVMPEQTALMVMTAFDPMSFVGCVVEDVPAVGDAMIRYTFVTDAETGAQGEPYKELIRSDGTVAGDSRRGDEIVGFLAEFTLTGNDGTRATEWKAVGFRVRRRVLPS